MTLLIILGANGESFGPIDIPSGERVLDACDEHAAPVLFSCRTASCGACRVSVLRGGELMSAAGSEERALLRGWSAGSDERLACQLVVVDGQGSIELRAIQAKPGS